MKQIFLVSLWCQIFDIINGNTRPSYKKLSVNYMTQNVWVLYRIQGERFVKHFNPTLDE